MRDMKKKVLLGMSGGIDSTVSALLLKEQGYEVVGVTFRTYDSMRESCFTRDKGCCSAESILEARDNAAKMGIEHRIVDFRKEFREHVISNFIDEYMHGRTPNPCVLCNAWIKWGEMLRLADETGCDFIATGHYARIAERDGHMWLRKAADEKKDQTYFLWRLTEDNLRRTLFPLGDYTKDEVRETARRHGYVKLAEKAESQEICFVPDNNYRTFLRDNVTDYEARVRQGAFLDSEGHRVGTHEGCCNYTIGQRKGLGIALGAPVYVTDINVETNTVSLGSYGDLYQTTLAATDIVSPDIARLQERPEVEARIRYRSKAVKARVEIVEKDGKVEVVLHFHEPVWGVTPGQSLVLYQDDLLVAAGVIQKQGGTASTDK